MVIGSWAVWARWRCSAGAPGQRPSWRPSLFWSVARPHACRERSLQPHVGNQDANMGYHEAVLGAGGVFGALLGGMAATSQGSGLRLRWLRQLPSSRSQPPLPGR